MRTVMEDVTPLHAAPLHSVATATDVPTHVDTTTGEMTGFSQGQFRTTPAQLNYGLGTRQQIQAELDDIARAVRDFHTKQPDQVMRECAAYTARLTELCVLLHRVESQDRQYTRVRTQQVERWLAELERQFKYASRIVEVMRQDLALAGAAT